MKLLPIRIDLQVRPITAKLLRKILSCGERGAASSCKPGAVRVVARKLEIWHADFELEVRVVIIVDLYWNQYRTDK